MPIHKHNVEEVVKSFSSCLRRCGAVASNTSKELRHIEGDIGCSAGKQLRTSQVVVPEEFNG